MEVFTLNNHKWNVTPNYVDGINNSSYLYYFEQLYRIAKSVFVFNNFPKSWDKDYFRDKLFLHGYIGVLEHGGDNYALECGFSGFDAYNKATALTFSNPVLGNFNRRLHIDGELIYMGYSLGNYKGIYPLLNRYAVWLALTDGSLCSTLINSRMASVFYTNNKAETESIKKMYDIISSGKPYAIMQSKRKIDKENDFLNVKNSYIGNDLLDTRRTIMNQFLTEIGIDNANTDKKERLNTEEVRSNNNECKAQVEEWKDTLNECFERVHTVFPTINVNVTLRFDQVSKITDEVINNDNTL